MVIIRKNVNFKAVIYKLFLMVLRTKAKPIMMALTRTSVHVDIATLSIDLVQFR